jgi:hypothetical protein
MGLCVARDYKSTSFEDLDTEIMQRVGRLGYYNKEIVPVVNKLIKRVRGNEISVADFMTVAKASKIAVPEPTSDKTPLESFYDRFKSTTNSYDAEKIMLLVMLNTRYETSFDHFAIFKKLCERDDHSRVEKSAFQQILDKAFEISIDYMITLAEEIGAKSGANQKSLE